MVLYLLLFYVHLLQKGDLFALDHQNSYVRAHQKVLDFQLHFRERVCWEEIDVGKDEEIAGAVVGSELLDDLLYCPVFVVYILHRMLLCW